jgi:hypothetical protein
MIVTLKTIYGGIVDILSDGSFVYMPADNFFGSDSFTYTVSDGNGLNSIEVVPEVRTGC